MRYQELDLSQGYGEIMLKGLFGIFFLFFLINTANAAWTGYGPGDRNSSSGSSSLSGIKFRLLGGLKLQHGTFGSSDDATVESQKMNGVGAEAVAGVNLGPFILGLGTEYTLWYQATDPKDVGNINLSGNNHNISAVGGFAFGKLCLIGKYHFKSTYSISQKSESDDKVKYTDPDASYSASLLYRLGRRSFISLDYNLITFTSEDRGSSTRSLGSDEEMILKSFGLTYGFMF